MAINESIWGDSSTYVTYMNNLATTIPTAMRLLYGDTLELNELIDNSPCFCGVLQDRNVCKMTRAGWLKRDFANPEIIPAYTQEEVTNIHLFNSVGSSPASQSIYTGNFTNMWGRWAEVSSPNDGNMSWYLTGNVRPLFNLKLNKLLWIPRVKVASSNDPDTCTFQNYDMHVWINEHTNDYPYLVKLTAIATRNRGTDANPDWTPAYDSYDDWIYFEPNLLSSNELMQMSSDTYKIRYDNHAYNGAKLETQILGIRTDGVIYTTSEDYILTFDDDIDNYVFGNSKAMYCREYSEELLEEIRTQLAFLGVFFIGDKITSGALTLTHPSVYCGIIDDNGYTHGEYSHGTDNEDRQQFSWDDTSESNYDPYIPPPAGDNWSDNTPSPFELSSKALSNHWWKMTDEDLYYVMRHINSVDLENLDYNQTFGMNPIDGVLQLRRIYVSPSMAQNVLIPTSMSQVVIGELSIGIPEATSLWYISANKPLIFNCCEDKWVNEPQSPKYEDFRAYAPFTSITFYDAFCGVIDIEPEKILNKYITITQSVDLITGDKITSLYASPSKGTSQRQRIATLQGNCAEEIPINGVAVADYMRNKMMSTHGVISSSFSAIGHIAMGAAGATISASMGNVLGAGAQALGTVANAASFATSITSKSNEISHTIPSIVKISNGTNNVESLVVTPPTLIMFLPKMLETYNEVEYGDKTGFAGYKIATLQSCGTGTHVVSHPRVNISGTSAEEYMLIDQLQKGIYVKEES